MASSEPRGPVDDLRRAGSAIGYGLTSGDVTGGAVHPCHDTPASRCAAASDTASRPPTPPAAHRAPPWGWAGSAGRGTVKDNPPARTRHFNAPTRRSGAPAEDACHRAHVVVRPGCPATRRVTQRRSREVLMLTATSMATPPRGPTACAASTRPRARVAPASRAPARSVTNTRSPLGTAARSTCAATNSLDGDLAPARRQATPGSLQSMSAPMPPACGMDGRIARMHTPHARYNASNLSAIGNCASHPDHIEVAGMPTEECRALVDRCLHAGHLRDTCRQHCV